MSSSPVAQEGSHGGQYDGPIERHRNPTLVCQAFCNYKEYNRQKIIGKVYGARVSVTDPTSRVQKARPVLYVRHHDYLDNQGYIFPIVSYGNAPIAKAFSYLDPKRLKLVRNKHVPMLPNSEESPYTAITVHPGLANFYSSVYLEEQLIEIRDIFYYIESGKSIASLVELNEVNRLNRIYVGYMNSRVESESQLKGDDGEGGGSPSQGGGLRGRGGNDERGERGNNNNGREEGRKRDSNGGSNNGSWRGRDETSRDNKRPRQTTTNVMINVDNESVHSKLQVDLSEDLNDLDYNWDGNLYNIQFDITEDLDDVDLSWDGCTPWLLLWNIEKRVASLPTSLAHENQRCKLDEGASCSLKALEKDEEVNPDNLSPNSLVIIHPHQQKSLDDETADFEKCMHLESMEFMNQNETHTCEDALKQPSSTSSPSSSTFSTTMTSPHHYPLLYPEVGRVYGGKVSLLEIAGMRRPSRPVIYLGDHVQEGYGRVLMITSLGGRAIEDSFEGRNIEEIRKRLVPINSSNPITEESPYDPITINPPPARVRIFVYMKEYKVKLDTLRYWRGPQTTVLPGDLEKLECILAELATATAGPDYADGGGSSYVGSNDGDMEFKNVESLLVQFEGNRATSGKRIQIQQLEIIGSTIPTTHMYGATYGYTQFGGSIKGELNEGASSSVEALPKDVEVNPDAVAPNLSVMMKDLPQQKSLGYKTANFELPEQERGTALDIMEADLEEYIDWEHVECENQRKLG